MIFSKAITDLAREVSKTALDQETKDKIKQSLNIAKIEVGKSALWNQLIIPNNELIIIPDYEVGTANVTQDSRIVTLVGGVVSSDFKGRYFQAQNSSYEYEIINVDISANTLTLKSAITEDSASGLTYSIRKKFYRVNSDIQCVLPNTNTRNLTSPFEIEGYDDYVSDYSCSIVLTENSKVLTGIGTAFLSNVYAGDMIEVESNIYRIQRISSDTEIIMTNKASAFAGTCTISSDTPYKAKLNGISPIIDVKDKSILRYSYIRNIYDMVNDSDNTELPAGFDRCIMDFAKAEFGRMTNGTNITTDYSIAQARLTKLKLDRELVYHSYNTLKQVIPSTMGRS